MSRDISKTKRPRAVLLIYGEGGHRAQMKRLHARVAPGLAQRNLIPVGVCENGDAIEGLGNFSAQAVRDKHSNLRTLIAMPISIISSAILAITIFRRYHVVAVISTGPGIAVIPSLILKACGAKIIFFESWSRFESASLTGRVMYRIADRFYIQHRSMSHIYQDAIYGGLL